MLDFIEKEQNAHIEAMKNIDKEKIEEIAIACNNSVKSGGKIIIFGNGGSASDAQHFAAELIGRYKLNRKSIASIALNTDTSAITAIGNDFGYDEIFARQLEGLGNSNDLIVAISTSGNSKNIILALEQAKKMGIKSVLLSGRDGGKAKDMSDLYFLSPSDDTPRIQEIHIFTIHIICDYVEKHFLDA